MATNDKSEKTAKDFLVIPSSTTKASTSSSVFLSASWTQSPSVKVDRKIEDAVYGYLRVIRSLGKTEVNTADISKALDIPQDVVLLVVPKLSHKGVRVVP